MVLQMHERVGEPLDVSSVRDYLEWVAGAQRAVQRLAQMLWAPISVAVRTRVLDEDDLGPAVSSYLPDSRVDEPGPAISFEDLRASATLEPWRVVADAARATECYGAARRAAERLEIEPLRSSLERHREGVLAELDAIFDQGPVTMLEADSRAREIMRGAYSHAPDQLRESALAIRAYNALVNNVLWAVLGIAEARDDLVSLEQDLGTVRLQGPLGAPLVTVTVASDFGWIGHPPSPYLVEGGLPIDGLYLSRGTMVQFAFEQIVDVTGSRLGDLEGITSAVAFD
jgi:hypothetical protein